MGSSRRPPSPHDYEVLLLRSEASGQVVAERVIAANARAAIAIARRAVPDGTVVGVRRLRRERAAYPDARFIGGRFRRVSAEDEPRLRALSIR